MLHVSRPLVRHVAQLLQNECRRLGTPKGSRALTPFWQAVLILCWFRGENDIPKLGRDHRVSRATAYRYIAEGIGVLAAQAPDLHAALDRAHADGLAYVILDGTLIPTDRCAEQTINVKGESIDAWYSGKAHQHAGNLQALSAPSGLPLWIAEVEPGSVHDLTAARTHVLAALYAASAADLPTLADSGYDGAGIGIHTPIKQPKGNHILSPDNRTYNRLLRALRCLGERGFALLKGRWRILQHITASPSAISDIARAALVLTHFEHNYLPAID
ncbi:DDE superfamily endonuclease [Nonomuraea fuscirosea]|uniref:DDE superfamily endonuclease n=2 Tax=Nonomuraea fuscirosea TaxID=1291556 RepID=A0A2T0MSI3_9ACTN|nr:transposase family protein [Nonomuraea fuscirosea]PRX61445.1 DDE superfamily endonuclease [Nonomuraea fuscirosea]